VAVSLRLVVSGTGGRVSAQDDEGDQAQPEQLITSDPTASVPAVPPMNLPTELVPIVDLHFHAEDGWDVPTLVDRLNGLGVAQAGSGGAPTDSIALSFAATAPGRFIPFGGQGAIRRWTTEQGEKAWNLQSPQLNTYLDQLE